MNDVDCKGRQDRKARRSTPPSGYVLLRSLKDPLGIHSDKLSEYARLGYIPSAIRCNPPNAKEPSTRFGIWYIAAHIAQQLRQDHHAGRPMPWHGKPLQDNLQVTFNLWHARQHPLHCTACQAIWGDAGAPRDWDAFLMQYPPLTLGAKRHLTRPWTPGLSLSDVARRAGKSLARVRRAIETGLLAAAQVGRHRYVSEEEAARWIAQDCPVVVARPGDSPAAAESLSADWLRLREAASEAGVSTTTLLKWVKDGELERRQDAHGWRYHREAVRTRAQRYWKTDRFQRALPPAWLLRAVSQGAPAIAGEF